MIASPLPVLTRAYEVVLLAILLWREARGEPYLGRVAIAAVVRNRVHNPSWWGKTWIDIITKEQQFSALTSIGDVNLVLWPSLTDSVFEECLAIARDIIEDDVEDPTNGADHYYSTSMAIPPKWVTAYEFKVQIGHHRFYES